MVLADTSVWIRSLRAEQPYISEMDALLSQDRIAGHELVYGELLIGDRGGRTRLLASYERIWQAAVVPHQEVAAFVRHRRLSGRGIGWIDAHLLASALVSRLQLWTADSPLRALAKQFGVAYDAPVE